MPRKPTRDDLLRRMSKTKPAPPKPSDEPEADPMPKDDPEALIEWGKRNLHGE